MEVIGDSITDTLIIIHLITTLPIIIIGITIGGGLLIIIVHITIHIIAIHTIIIHYIRHTSQVMADTSHIQAEASPLLQPTQDQTVKADYMSLATTADLHQQD